MFVKYFANHFHSGGDVSPLVCSAELHLDPTILIEIQEIVALEKLVAEFGEGHSLAGIAGETLLDGILAHHVIDGDKLADVAGEVYEGVILHPVVVVHQFRLVRGVGFEIEEP